VRAGAIPLDPPGIILSLADIYGADEAAEELLEL